MATIDLGKIRFNWQGAYNNSTAYVINDVVSSGGNSYICKLASTGNAVSNGTYWDLMSQAGTNGTNGTDVGTVITTQGDILYRDGSGLQRLAKGTASQVLAINSGATAPEWVAPAGGATERLGGATFNAAEAIINPTGFDMEYNVATGYDAYKLYIAVFTVSNAQYVQLRTSRDNGSTWLSSGYNSNTHGRHGTSDSHGAENGDSRFDLIKPKTSDNNPLARLHMEITMYKDTYEDSYFNATMIFAGQVGVASGATWGGTATLCSAYTAIDALKLSCSSGNIDGNWTMYGFKSS